MIKVFKCIIGVLFLTVLLLGVPKLSGIIASTFDYQYIDPDGAYAWISVHHIVQAFIFIMIMTFLNKFKSLEYGFGWGDKEVGKKYVILFSLFFSIYTAGAFLTVILTKSFQQFSYPLTAVNIIGQMGFQLLLSGSSEELIFRGFAITMLALIIKDRVFNGKVSIANIIGAVIFGLAHVNFSFTPFEIRYNLFQIMYAIILGLFYGDCYEKTNSMLYPMMMHSISNVVMVGVTIILSLII
ncbi:CPBP family intramembrane glutamic endopeptidase [Natronincola ferrireducens]|uniref:CAAX protease self-immunity n=1 Tax=Natronincola ferrireducens TaxID=393762 RepID=A0A1G9E765_9FIRM|nr:CPBP family intramembrane glutamic endopeptidase [Natronincola ferrireducens]SDK71927.1 CAAX protease self-immunity [Natronincola ferrireducens]